MWILKNGTDESICKEGLLDSTLNRDKVRFNQGLPQWFSGKESTCNAGDADWIPRLGRSPGEGNGNLFQYFCWENPMDRVTWQATVQGVAKSRTWLSMQIEKYRKRTIVRLALGVESVAETALVSQEHRANERSWLWSLYWDCGTFKAFPRADPL